MNNTNNNNKQRSDNKIETKPTNAPLCIVTQNIQGLNSPAK